MKRKEIGEKEAKKKKKRKANPSRHRRCSAQSATFMPSSTPCVLHHPRRCLPAASCSHQIFKRKKKICSSARKNLSPRHPFAGDAICP
jgi:hypothetical protein